MKKVLSAVLGLAIALGPVGIAGAEDEDVTIEGFSGNVALTSDYVWRGIGQSANGAAIQGGMDWNHASGFYIGLWGSNINFEADDDASLELDIYTGYGGNFTDNFSYDVNLTAYTYPGADSDLDYHFWEVGGSLAYDFNVVALDGGIFYSPETFGKGGQTLYYKAGAGIPLPAGFSLTGTIGYYTFDEDNDLDYLHYDVGVAYDIAGLTLGLMYTATDIDECGDNDACDGQAVVSLGYSF